MQGVQPTRKAQLLTCHQVEETSGWVCVAMRGADLDRLQLPLLVPPPLNDEALRTAFAMPVDLAAGTTTGIDAHDRQGVVRHCLRTGRFPQMGLWWARRSLRMLLQWSLFDRAGHPGRHGPCRLQCCPAAPR